MDSVNNSLSVLDELKRQFEQSDSDLDEVRSKNHEIYYKIDLDFLKHVDLRYKSTANSILNMYNKIIPIKLLTDDNDTAHNNEILLKRIYENTDKLKKEVKKDLVNVVDYVDRVFNRLDISNINKDTPLGIFIINKYNALKIFSANIDIENINRGMKNQSQRLVWIKELQQLIDKYKEISTMYTIENTKLFINNLYYIVGNYIHLLTNQEYEYTKEAIKKMLSYQFNFIDKYIYTYKIIMSKIWHSTGLNTRFVCNLDLDDDNVYIMFNNNIKDYWDSGYICSVPEDFFDYFKISDMNVINFPLPINVKKMFKLNTGNFNSNNIQFCSMYTKFDKINFDSILPVVYLNEDK